MCEHFSSSLTLTLTLTCLLLGGCVESEGSSDVPTVELPSDDRADSWNEPIDPASCPGGEVQLVNGAPAAWTFIHWAAADNNLEEVIVEDINEMERGHQGSPNVNILVQLDRRGEDGVWRYRVQPDDDEALASPLIGYSQEEPDSGDWRTLAAFGRWAAFCYPAERYMVVIGGHGAGWSTSDGSDDRSAASLRDRIRHLRASAEGESVREIAPDDSEGSSIHIDELAAALDAISEATRRDSDPDWVNRLVAYGSDACLMETIEVAYDLRNAVTYLIGSEETEPGQGWPYSTIIRDLTERPYFFAERPWELASTVVDDYGRSYGPSGVAQPTDRITMAAVDTAAVIRARNRVDRIAQMLLELIPEEATLHGHLVAAREASFTFGAGYTDLGLLLAGLRTALVDEGLAPDWGEPWDGDERWRELRETIDELLDEVWAELVVASRAGEGFPGATGLSIFMPRDRCGWGLDLEGYARSDFALDTSWDELAVVLVDGMPGVVAEATGPGTVDATVGGVSFPELEASCERFSDRLSVYVHGPSPCVSDSESGDCLPAPELALDIALDGEALTVTDAFLRAVVPAEVDQELDGLELSVSNAEVVDESSYSGAVSVVFTAENDDAELALDLSFSCTGLETQECQNNWWW